MTATTTPRHTVSAATAQMREIADSVADATVWSMEPVEAGKTLVQLTRLEAQISELKARVAAHADSIDVGAEDAAASTANWLAHQTKQTRPAAHGVVRFGYRLGAHPVTRDALAAGEVMVDQAQVILRAVDQLPDDLDQELLAKAEAHLVAEAEHHDAKTLRILGRRLLEVIAPDQADAHEARLLEREERDAARATHFTARSDGHGTTNGRFRMPDASYAQLHKLLLAFSAPKHVTATEGPGVERRPTPERLGRAFVELIDAFPADRAPKSGGTNATIVVTISHEALIGTTEQAGVLDTGEHLSASAVRRLACTAGIIPAVLGGHSEILDLGRTRRLFNNPQRIWLAQKYGGCAAADCDWPPGLCHAHHLDPWAQGGHTDVHRGVLLCPHHHTRAHDPHYETRQAPDGTTTFHRRE